MWVLVQDLLLVCCVPWINYLAFLSLNVPICKMRGLGQLVPEASSSTFSGSVHPSFGSCLCVALRRFLDWNLDQAFVLMFPVCICLSSWLNLELTGKMKHSSCSFVSPVLHGEQQHLIDSRCSRNACRLHSHRFYIASLKCKITCYILCPQNSLTDTDPILRKRGTFAGWGSEWREYGQHWGHFFQSQPGPWNIFSWLEWRKKPAILPLPGLLSHMANREHTLCLSNRVYG